MRVRVDACTYNRKADAGLVASGKATSSDHERQHDGRAHQPFHMESCRADRSLLGTMHEQVSVDKKLH